MRCVAEPIPSPHPTHDSLLRLEHTRKISAICLSARDASKTHSKPPFGPRQTSSARSLPISPKKICFRPPRFATTGAPFSPHPRSCGPASIAVVHPESPLVIPMTTLPLTGSLSSPLVTAMADLQCGMWTVRHSTIEMVETPGVICAGS